MERHDRIVLCLCVSAILGSAIGYSKVWLFHFVLISFLFLYGRASLRSSRLLILSPVSGGLLKIFLLFFSWYLLSVLWAPNILYWVRYIGYLSLGGCLMFVIAVYACSEKKYLRVISAVKFSIVFALFIGLLEAFTPFRLPTSPYSEYAFFFGREALDMSKFNREAIEFLRSSPTSFWGNPNNFAVAMAMSAPYFMLRARRLICFLGLIAVAVIVIMAGSRGAMVAFLAGLFACLLWAKYDHMLAVFFAALCVLLITPPVSYSVAVNSPRLAQMSTLVGDVERYFQSDAGPGVDVARGDSIQVRGYLLELGISAFLESRGIGVGAGGGQAILEIAQGGQGLSAMHNFWIELLVEGGVAGFSLLCAFSFLAIVSLLKIAQNRKCPFYADQARMLVLSWIVFSIGCISMSTAIYFLPVWILLGLTIALIEINRRVS